MKKKILLSSLAIIVILGLAVYINPDQFFTKLILKMAGSYVPPEYETDSTILRVMEEHKVSFDRLFKLSDYTSMRELQEQKLFTLPFIQIYDEDKRLMKAASGSECSWALMNYFNQQDSTQLVAYDSTMYDQMMKLIIPVSILAPKDTFDYYVLAGWANFSPKFAHELFKETNKIKQKLNGEVCINYINLDFQEGWESELESR